MVHVASHATPSLRIDQLGTLLVPKGKNRFLLPILNSVALAVAVFTQVVAKNRGSGILAQIVRGELGV